MGIVTSTNALWAQRRAMMFAIPKINVTWNQQAPVLDAENWRAYNADYLTVDFNDGISTLTWLKSAKGYNTSIRPIISYDWHIGEILYCRYDIFPDRDGEWGIEAGGHIFEDTTNCVANQWNSVRLYGEATKDGWRSMMMANWRGATGNVGMEVQMRNPLYVNLTTMYGAGNEPTKEEFERQCALNGIDLSTYQPVDAGTVRPWISRPVDG